MTPLASTPQCWFKCPRTTRYSGIVSPVWIQTVLITFLTVRHSDRPVHCTVVAPHGVSNGSCGVQGCRESAELEHVQFLPVCCLPDDRRGPRNRTDNGRDCRNQLEYYGQFAACGKHIGNECLLWHGTRRVCNLGDPGNTALCANPGCALCSIIYGSFDVSKVATNTNWARFGAGIYTSTVSSKWVHKRDRTGVSGLTNLL